MKRRRQVVAERHVGQPEDQEAGAQDQGAIKPHRMQDVARQSEDADHRRGNDGQPAGDPYNTRGHRHIEEVVVVEVYSNEIGLDQVLLYLVPANTSEECDHQIRAYLQARLRVSPHIKYLTAEEILKIQFPEAGRKAVKFIDKRTSLAALSPEND